MSLRFAFMGFRHDHILTLYNRVKEAEELELVAACEEDEADREAAADKKGVDITHADFETMLDDVPCDVVAIGDYFARRGSVAIAALERGKHVIVDKPLCTDLSEVDEIERLSREKGLKVGCMLTRRDLGCSVGARELIRGGTIGEVHAISFMGQHPLLLGSRPGWYFEPGKHGGSITDIAIHAVDFIPWMTGLEFETANAARCWNAFAPERPCFKDGAQMMLTMDNGCGVIGDVSYHMPDGAGYTLPFYWRVTFWGRKGVLEIWQSGKEMSLALDTDKELGSRPLPEGNPGGHLWSFVRDIRGETGEEELCTESVIKAARTVNKIQKAADDNARDVDLRVS